MISKIKEYSKSFFVKVLVGIITLPFIFWGMGDIFSGGSQNVVAKIDSEKISTQEFINYVRMLNIEEKDREKIINNNILEKILSSYIGNKVLELELNDLRLIISDKSLKNIIINDKTFFKDNAFSRTEYEKFLITSNLSAPQFEENIAQQEKKRQLLEYLSSGIKIPKFITEREFNKENQIKEIKYINLSNLYKKKEISKNQLADAYNKNKSFFKETFKEIKYLYLDPELIIGSESPNEKFFKIINKIENDALDGKQMDAIRKNYNLTIKSLNYVNSQQKDTKGEKISFNDNKLFEKIYSLQEKDQVEIVNHKNKYYLVKISNIIEKEKNIDDPDVIKLLEAQLNIENKIKENIEIAKLITTNNFSEQDMIAFGKKNSLEIKTETLNGLNTQSIFTKGIKKRIFETSDNEVNLITDNNLENNYIVFSKNTKYLSVKPSDKEYQKFEKRAKLILSDNIFNKYDQNLNKKYKVNLNKKTLDRIKDSF